MPTAIVAQDILRGRLRSRLGNPDHEEVSDADLDSYMYEALSEVNVDRPASALLSFPTVADQSGYDVVPDVAYRIKKVWWVGQRSSTANVFGIMLDMLNFSDLYVDMGAGVRIIDNPALVTAYSKKLRSYSNSFNGRGMQRPDDGNLYLYPTPTSSDDTVWFEYTYPRFATVAAVQEKYYTPLMLLAQAAALEAMAHQRSHIVSSNEAGGSYSTGGGHIQIKRAQQLRERYQREFKNTPVGWSYQR